MSKRPEKLGAEEGTRWQAWSRRVFRRPWPGTGREVLWAQDGEPFLRA